jgi:hypothetical protein
MSRILGRICKNINAGIAFPVKIAPRTAAVCAKPLMQI